MAKYGGAKLHQLEIEKHYQNMWQCAWPLINSNQTSYDPYLCGKLDTRRGITLLARITAPVNSAITEFLQELYALEPQQYYYPSCDLHVTVMSVLSCIEDYQLSLLDKPKYVDLIRSIVKNTPRFFINFDGITLADSGVLLRGYVNNQSLENLRSRLRIDIKNCDAPHSMDTRYTIVTAHSTVMRFRQKLQNPLGFADFLCANRQRYFGQVEVTQLELVVNDWYQRQGNTESLGTFQLSVV
jgi:hypothetical protein